MNLMLQTDTSYRLLLQRCEYIYNVSVKQMINDIACFLTRLIIIMNGQHS